MKVGRQVEEEGWKIEVRVKYGRGAASLDIPEGNVAAQIYPNPDSTARQPAEEFEKALGNPVGELLEELCTGSKTCFLVEDGTRSEPYREIIDTIVRRLKNAESLTCIITTGSHEPDEEGNHRIEAMLREACEDYKIKNYSVIIHDCLKHPHEYVGATTRGTEVYTNRYALGHDLYVVASDMKNHYFAGYSNSIKNFLPGICSFRT